MHMSEWARSYVFFIYITCKNDTSGVNQPAPVLANRYLNLSEYSGKCDENSYPAKGENALDDGYLGDLCERAACI